MVKVTVRQENCGGRKRAFCKIARYKRFVATVTARCWVNDKHFATTKRHNKRIDIKRTGAQYSYFHFLC